MIIRIMIWRHKTELSWL